MKDNFSDPVHALPKFEGALANGLNVEIMAIHLPAEQALANTLLRFEREGRGATIEALARIQGYLPSGLRQIRIRFGDAIRLTVIDKRDTIVGEKISWDAISLLELEGNYEHIKQKLTDFLKAQYASGLVAQATYEQAFGQTTPSFD